MHAGLWAALWGKSSASIAAASIAEMSAMQGAHSIGGMSARARRGPLDGVHGLMAGLSAKAVDGRQKQQTHF